RGEAGGGGLEGGRGQRRGGDGARDRWRSRGAGFEQSPRRGLACDRGVREDGSADPQPPEGGRRGIGRRERQAGLSAGRRRSVAGGSTAERRRACEVLEEGSDWRSRCAPPSSARRAPPARMTTTTCRSSPPVPSPAPSGPFP